MSKENRRRVFYVCFYSDPETESAIVTYPSVISKIDYIVEKIKKSKAEVILLSIAPSCKGLFTGYSKIIDELETHVYLRSRKSSQWLQKRINFVVHNARILLYLLKNIRKNDRILVYHSLYNRFWLRVLYKLVPDKIILQIEDVFSELTPVTAKWKSSEWKLLHQMKKCICVNDIIYRELSDVPQKVISYGSYATLPQYDVVQYEAIRLVYAGVIEQERNAAFLAVKAMQFLNLNYELHILGFGNDEDIEALQNLITQVNNQKKKISAIYHGRMAGETYWQFLQSCDIALSTHAYTPQTQSSADYTFPSKVLTYLANGLRVVAQRLEVLECSSIADQLCFYENPNPQEIAEAVSFIDLKKSFDSRTVIANLDQHFEYELSRILDISDIKKK